MRKIIYTLSLLILFCTTSVAQIDSFKTYFIFHLSSQIRNTRDDLKVIDSLLNKDKLIMEIDGYSFSSDSPFLSKSNGVFYGNDFNRKVLLLKKEELNADLQQYEEQLNELIK